MVEENWDALAWFLGCVILGMGWAAVIWFSRASNYEGLRGAETFPVPDCMFCGSRRTFVTHSMHPQIRCRACGSSGPRVAPLPNEQDTRSMAARTWTGWQRVPLQPPNQGSSVIPPSRDPRNGPGFRPPSPRPSGF